MALSRVIMLSEIAGPGVLTDLSSICLSTCPIKDGLSLMGIGMLGMVYIERS